MSKVSPVHFLECRAQSLRGVAKQYEALAKMCRKLDVKPLSGDIMEPEQWANNINYFKPDYCPREKDGAIILTMRMGEPEPGRGRDVVVAALIANSDSLFCTTLIGGNHDMSVGELTDALKRIRKGVLARIFGAWPGNETEEQVREALEKLS